MRILFIGDIFGTVGRHILLRRLDSLRRECEADVCIGNGENVAGGVGITGNLVRKLHHYGIEVITGGNHSFTHVNSDRMLFDSPHHIRPLNYPPGNPGFGTTVYELPDGRRVGVINLQGRTFSQVALDCPFRAVGRAIEELMAETMVLMVDFHAEASSEKIALAQYIDGRVSAVVGTHTHVQTADERVLPGGTAFITDVGMTGPEDSAIGMKSDTVIRRFLLQSRIRLEPADTGPMLNAVVMDIDEATGRAQGISRIFERIPVL